jgi:magnesium transporter
MAPDDVAPEAEENPWKKLQALTDAGDAANLDDYVNSLDPTARIRAFSRLDEEEQARLMLLVSPESAADLIEDLPDAHAATLIEQIDAEQAADIVEELDSDQGADLLADLDHEDANAILAQMVPESAGNIRHLITYPDHVAGGLMGTEEFSCLQTATVGDFLEEFRANKDERGDLPQRILLVDRHRRLVGGVAIADILLADRTTQLSSLSQPVVPISDSADLEELEDYFDRYETLGAPVVNAVGELVGRLRRRAIDEALSERAQGDQLRSQGIVGGEELRSMSISTRTQRRFSWLSVNILLNILAASVIAYFEDTLSAVIALAVFLPIVSDMSGCAGFQAVAVSMRELTLGIVQPRDVLRVWWKEVSVGLLNGVALGILIGLVAYLWKGNPMLGLVVGLALGLNTIIAVSVGGAVPLLLKGFRSDPAVASGPVLTTITDMCGFFLVLGLATLALPWLT